MLSFIEPSLTEALMASLRSLVADALPPAAAIGLALAIATAVVARVRARHGHPRGRQPRPLPAAV